MQALLNKTVNFPIIELNPKINIGSDIFSLEKIVKDKIQFNIPIYQRLYVWKENQIKTLLEDLKNSFEKDKNEFYFLGSVMLSNTEIGKVDLVDGQQRFTTLWLISEILSHEVPILENFIHFNAEPRIHFSIREKAQQYLKDKHFFNKYLNDKGEPLSNLEMEVSEIIPLASGRKIISDILKEFKKSEKFNVTAFGNYLFEKVILMYTIIPSESDLNRVFEAMNNRGKQLEHHEILKSRLLQIVEEEKRHHYSLIWDASSKMNTYIEKNIKEVANLSWKQVFKTETNVYSDSDEKEVDFIDNNLLEELKSNLDKEKKAVSLIDILDPSYIPEKTETRNTNNSLDNSDTDYNSRKIRSIISFETFLLHTFRVHQIKTKNSNYDSAEVSDKKLLDIFNIQENFKNAEEVRQFIELVWKLRVLFDKYVIKWIYFEEEREEYHSLEFVQVSKSFIKNKNGTENENLSIQRIEVTSEEQKDLIKLQGMLYHSQEMTTQYWLTPFLHFLEGSQNLSNYKVLKQLEKIENELFYSSSKDKKLKDRSFEIAFLNEKSLAINLKNTKFYLESCLGTDYPSYIFYKLEYVLWKYKNEICKELNLDLEKWKKFRFTAKNSVEHIFPQTTKDENRHIEFISEEQINKLNLQNKKPIDDFGNLVLLSIGLNSEYSNKPYKEKMGQYSSKNEIDSLKSDLIFRNNEWDYEKAFEHRDKMIKYMEKYLDDLKS